MAQCGVATCRWQRSSGKSLLPEVRARVTLCRIFLVESPPHLHSLISSSANTCPAKKRRFAREGEKCNVSYLERAISVTTIQRSQVANSRAPDPEAWRSQFHQQNTKKEHQKSRSILPKINPARKSLQIAEALRSFAKLSKIRLKIIFEEENRASKIILGNTALVFG